MRSNMTSRPTHLSDDLAWVAELVWENEGGRLRPVWPDGVGEEPDADETGFGCVSTSDPMKLDGLDAVGARIDAALAGDADERQAGFRS